MLNKSSFFSSLIRPKNILVLDFDGVFLDSEKIKANTFVNLFSNLSNYQIEKIKKHHIEHPSLTRFEKIKIYYEWINKKDLKEFELNILVKKFGVNCLDLMLRNEPSKFIKNLLLFRGENSINYILTKSIEEEVLEYINKYQINKYIHKIYDFRFEKSPCLKEISLINKVAVNDVIFIGDSIKDKEASDLAGSTFIFYKVGLLYNENKFK